MNLLTSSWLSAVKCSGEVGNLSPLDVGDPVWKDISAIRADFRGGLYQFLIGVLQLGYAPQDTSEWRERYEEPPSRDELAKSLARYVSAFELDGDGPAFMQDYELTGDLNRPSVTDLLIDAGSDSNLFFNKQPEAAAFCEHCFAQALFTLQINAPSGGRGVRTSLRGGGPLTSLLVPDEKEGDEPVSLWQRLWLNVLPMEALEGDTRSARKEMKVGDVLPWMAPTRTSDTNGAPGTTPESVHPLQAYWSMPRRIRIDNTTVEEAGTCTLCAAQGVKIIRHYKTRHGGTNYTGNWLHPLTPYRLDAQGKKPPISVKGGMAGRGYREWLGLVLGNDDHEPDPASVVRHFMERLDDVRDVGIWCFGYEMNNMKALCWHEGVLPYHHVAPENRIALMTRIKTVLDACEVLSTSLNRQVKAARFKNPKEVKKSDPAVIEGFWSRTEGAFYKLLQSLIDLPSEGATELSSVYRNWFLQVRKDLFRLFDHWALSVPLEELDMARVVRAREGLQKDLMLDKKLLPIFDVAFPERKRTKKGAKRAKKASVE